MRDLRQLYRERAESNWLRFLSPPPPLIHNPSEPSDFPMGKWNLYVGGAGREVAGYVNLDLFAVPGVDVDSDAGLLPFRDGTFTRIECDAVLEHVASAEVWSQSWFGHSPLGATCIWSPPSATLFMSTPKTIAVSRWTG